MFLLEMFFPDGVVSVAGETDLQVREDDPVACEWSL
jgi:hypothetical protein